MEVDLQDGTGNRRLWVRNIGAGFMGFVDTGEVRSTLTDDGTGDFVASNEYKYNTTDRANGADVAVIDAVRVNSNNTLLAASTGTPTIDVGGAEVNNIFCNSGIGHTVQMLIPIQVPDGFIVEAMRLRSYRVPPAVVTAQLASWVMTASGHALEAGTLVTSTAGGAWVNDNTTGIGVTLNNAVGLQWYVVIVITNDGVANDTARFGRLTISGLAPQVNSFTP